MRMVIAGGGTGGHLFPGIAIAEAFREREKGNEVLFIGTERGIEKKALAGGPFPLRMIQALPLKGRSLQAKRKALLALPQALREAFSILRDFRPQIVVGVGGYASGPALVAAFLLGIRRAIHEQNMVPGMTNRILKYFVEKVFVSFEESRQAFPKGKTFVTGNPIRKAFFSRPVPSRPGGDRFTVLVFGGSAGAHRINEAVMEALEPLSAIRSSLRFIHQTGTEDLPFVERHYREKGFEAVVGTFFEDMAAQYQAADLVICRAGAGTLAELAVCGRGAILIPYPYAAQQHQLVNAQKLVALRAARMIRDQDLNGDSLARMIREFHSRPEALNQMAEAIRLLAHPRAAEEIVDRCYALVQEVRT